MLINASSLSYQTLNESVRKAGGECRIEGQLGQRFIGAGLADCRISIDGIPGNALGAYLNGASIHVDGNAQDAVGDTMNAGTIVVHGVGTRQATPCGAAPSMSGATPDTGPAST